MLEGNTHGDFSRSGYGIFASRSASFGAANTKSMATTANKTANWALKCILSMFLLEDSQCNSSGIEPYKNVFLSC